MPDRLGRIAALVAAAALVATGLAACGSSSRFTGVRVTGEAVTKAQVEKLLVERAKAVRAGDRQAFLATVDTTDEGVRRQQEMLFGNLRRIPFVRYELSAGTTAMPQRSVNGWSNGVVTVYETTQIREADSRPSNLAEPYVLFVRGDRLVLAPDQARYEPWENAELRTETRPGLMVAVTAEDAAHLHEIADVVERAHRQCRAQWERSWQQQFAIFATSDDKMFDKVWFSAANLTDAAGYVTSTPLLTETGGYDPERGNARVVLNLNRIGDAEERQAVVCHELTHAAASNETSRETPAWVVEGFAEYVADAHYNGIPADGFIRLKGFLSEAGTKSLVLPAETSPAAFYGKEAERNYLLAFLAFQFLADRYGAEAPRRFFVAAQGAGALPEAFRSLGTTRERFLADWNVWFDRGGD